MIKCYPSLLGSLLLLLLPIIGNARTTLPDTSVSDTIWVMSPDGHLKCIIKKTVLCATQEVQLGAYLEDIGGNLTPITVPWSTGETAQKIIIQPPGFWSYNDAGFTCDHHLNNITINETFFTGNIDILGPPAFCPGIPVDLTVNTDNYNFSNYTWSPNIFNTLTPVTIIGPGNYSLTLNDQLGCPFVDNLLVPMSPPVVPILQGPNILCTQGDTGVINISPAFFDYVWSNGETSYPLQVTEPGFYEVTVTNQFGCTGTGIFGIQNGDVDNFNIFVSTDTICPGQMDTLSINGPFIQYNWSSGNTTPYNVIHQPGAYAVTVTNVNGCTGTQSVVVPSYPAPFLSFSGPPLCPGDSTTLMATSNLAVNFHWSTGATTPSIPIYQPGTYSVTISAPGQCTVSASNTVVLGTQPTVLIAAPGQLNCSTPSLFLNASGSSYGQGYQLNWTTPDGNIVSGQDSLAPLVDAAGTYILHVTDFFSGCFSTDTAVVTAATLPPMAEAGPGQMLNCAITTLSLGPPAAPADTSLQYNWSTANGNIISGSNAWNPLIDQPGTYALQVTNPASGCTATDTVTISQNLATPSALIATPDTLTCTMLEIMLDASASTGNNLDFQWSTLNGNIVSGMNTALPVVSATGLYEFILTNLSTGCADTSAVQVFADANIPVALAAAPDTLNCNILQINLSGLGSSAGANIVYQWTTSNGNILSGENTLSPLVNQPGTYTLQVLNNANNCSAIFNLPVFENVVPPLADAGAMATLSCTLSSLQLDASGSDAGNNFSYNWSSLDGNILAGDTTLFPTIGAPGTYTLEVNNNQNGCTAVSSVVVMEDANAPTVSIAGAPILDCNNTVVTLDGGSSSSGPNFTYFWTGVPAGIQGNNTNSIVTLNAPGSYTLLVTNIQNGCQDSATVVVSQDIIPPFADAGAAFTLNCFNTSTTVGSNQNPVGAPFQIQWSTLDGNITSGANGPTPTINQPGTYTIIVSNTQNGCSTSDTVLISADFNAPTVSAGPGFQLDCQHNTDTLQSSSPNSGNLQIQWTTQNGNILSGSTTFNPIVNAAGTYTLTLTDLANGCTATDVVQITQSANLPVAVAGLPDTLSCSMLSVNLNATGSTSGPMLSYAWSTLNGNILSGNNTLMPLVDAPGNYILTVTDASNGCTAVSSVSIAQNLVSPSLTATSSGELNCQQTSLSLQANIITAYSGQLAYSWGTANGSIVSGSATATPVVDAPGLYTVTVTDQYNGCSSTAQVSVVEDITQPIASIAQPDTLSCAVTDVVLNGAGSSAGLNITYLWSSTGGNISGPLTSLQTSADQPGTYALLVTNSTNGCTQSISVLVNQDIQVPLSIAGTAAAITCNNASSILNGSGSSQGPKFTYLWSSNDGLILSSPSILLPEVLSGTYQLLVTNTQNGCTATDQVVVNADTTAPAPTIASPGILTCIQTSSLLNGMGINMGNNPVYGWSTSNGNLLSGANTLQALAGAPGEYTLVITNTDNGCSNSTTTTVSANTTTPSAQIQQPGLLTCTQLTLNLQGSTAAQNTVSWSSSNGNIISGANTLTPQINAPGDYHLVVTGFNNGCTATAQIQVQEETNIPIDFQYQLLAPNCKTPNGTLTFLPVNGGIGPYAYSIDGGQQFHTAAVFQSLLPGNYNLVVQDVNGCELDQPLLVPDPIFPTVSLPPNFILNLGQEMQLDPVLPPGFPLSSIDSVVWEPLEHLRFTGNSIQQQLHPYAMPLQNTVYTLTIITPEGCRATARTNILVKTAVDVYVPNVIRAEDSKGLNDIFTIFADERAVQNIRSCRYTIVGEAWYFKILT
ncbi:MAG: hypothetical protein IPL65_14370 [Lewinellaceae bacterium]|nr:hypothetical protein [Lewinellaceae bacterium]